jgi:hypothetical protein
VRLPSRSALLAAAFAAALLASLVLVSAAAATNGEGLAGSASDKTVTLFCFGVIAFFPLLVITLSFVQGRLDARKERRRYDLERLDGP